MSFNVKYRYTIQQPPGLPSLHDIEAMTGLPHSSAQVSSSKAADLRFVADGADQQQRARKAARNRQPAVSSLSQIPKQKSKRSLIQGTGLYEGDLVDLVGLHAPVPSQRAHRGRSAVQRSNDRSSGSARMNAPSSRLDAAIFRTQAKTALTGLGWKPAIARAAVTAAAAGAAPDVTQEQLIYAFLRHGPVPKV
jgi:hypothetical protein